MSDSALSMTHAQTWDTVDALVRACVEGVREAWAQLFRDHAPALQGLLMNAGASREEAEDVVGDVFVELIQHRRQNLGRTRFEGSGKLRIYLAVLAKWRYQDLVRTKARGSTTTIEPRAEGIVAAGEISDGDCTEDEVQARMDAARAMALVSPQERFILGLYYCRGLRLREIAELTGRPIGAVSAIVFGARDKMRRGMQEHEPDERSSAEGILLREGRRGYRPPSQGSTWIER